MRTWTTSAVLILGAIAVLAIGVGTADATARRECAGIEGLRVFAQGKRTTCGFAQATAKSVQAYMSEHQGMPEARFSVRALGRTMACHRYLFDGLVTFGCSGKMRSVLIQEMGT